METTDRDIFEFLAEKFCNSDLFVGLSFVYWSKEQLAEERKQQAYGDETEEIVSDLEQNPRTVIGQWRVTVDEEGRLVRTEEFIDYNFNDALRDHLKAFLDEHPDDKERIIRGVVRFLEESINQVISLNGGPIPGYEEVLEYVTSPPGTPKTADIVNAHKHQDQMSAALEKMRARFPAMTSGDLQSAVTGMQFLLAELGDS